MAKRLLAALIAAALFGSFGCRKAATQTRLRIAYESDPISLDPAAVVEAATDAILSNFYERLVTFDRDMRLVPALAVSWSTPDERTWVFQLRKDVRFHDGRILTIADAKYSLDRARREPSGVKSFLSTVTEVIAEGESSLRLKTVQRDPLLLNRLTYIAIVPASPGLDLTVHPVGTGPYRFVKRRKGGPVEAEAFAQYWGGVPPIRQVEFLTVEEGEGSIKTLKEGRADVLRWVPETLVDQARALPGVRVLAHSGLTSYYLWFDCRAGKDHPFADARVRRAVSLAIDRREIIKQLKGLGVPATQLVQPGVFGYVETLPPLRFDPGEARRLLVEAGYGSGFDATLVHRSQSSVLAVGRSLQAMLGNVGIRLTLQTADWTGVVARWNAGRLPFFLAAWRFDDGDALSFLRDCLYTRDPRTSTGSFNAGYSNRELDRLIDENAQTPGEDRRFELYQRLMALAVDEMPLVPLFHRSNLYGVSNRVRWQPRVDGKLLAGEMAWSE